MDFTEINHLLELSRIELSSQEKKKISLDLEKILDYVKQLQEVDTAGKEPMTGGTFLENVCQEDKTGKEKKGKAEELKKSAPKMEGDYFKIPPIFE